jgi:copper chaperone
MTEINLRIDGMHCGACIRRVTQTLQTVSGADVEEVRLGAARVLVSNGSTSENLISALGKAGFAAQEER